MRASTVRRAIRPLGALVCLMAVSSAASADPAAGPRVVTRAGSPWLHVTPRARATAARPYDAERNARSALSRVSPFAASSAASLVATSTERFGDGETIVHFEQAHRGLPVIGRGATVRLSPAGETIVTAIDLEEHLPAVVPSLAASRAAAVAARVSAVAASADDAHLVVWPLRGGGARLAYAVLPRIPEGIPMAPRVIVDAQSGKVLEARDLLTYAKASVHRANPTKTPQIENLDLALAPTSATLSNDFISSWNCVDNKTVKPVNLFGFAMSMHVCDIEQLATSDANGDFVYAPADVPGSPESKRDEYAEVSMYFHSARAYGFFRDLQGSPDAKVVVDKPLRVIANLQLPPGITSGNFAAAGDANKPLDPMSNAFFSPAGGQLGAIFQQLYGFKTGALWFGQGPQRDYSYDGDVVYHEFVHAVVDATLRLEAWHVDARGAIDSPGAMNEGIADYFSSAITGDPDIGEYASADLDPNGGVMRTLANQDKCPSHILGEVHRDSTLFSGALWQARTSLPEADRAKFDAAIYKAMRTNPGSGDLGFDDAAKLFMATLGTDLPAGSAALEKAMTDRGVLPACERIIEWQDKPIRPFETGYGGWAAPGTQIVPVGDLAPGIIQVHAKLAAPTSTVTVKFTLPKSGGPSANPLGGNATPFAPVVLAKVNAPITWTVKDGAGTHDAELSVAAETGTAALEIPEGATDIYVQIANKGESDGHYDSVVLELTPRAVTEPPATQPTAPPGSSAEVETGCGCSTPGSTPTAPLAGVIVGLGLAVGALRRRRG